jgi:Raf kinase inhibitor-like YbhB/YbcL family protein
MRLNTFCTSVVLTIALLTNLASGSQKHALAVTSRDLTNGARMPRAQVYDGFGCNGKNISPELIWSGAPRGTKSFAVMAFDPDAPTGSGWWHWVVYDIPSGVTSLRTGASRHSKLLKGALEGINDYGVVGYGGAAAPPGTGLHHYRFTVYALSVTHLPTKRSATSAMIGFYVHQNELAHGSIEVTYSR